MITEPRMLTPTERAAIDAYDAWVEDDLPSGRSRVRHVAALIGVAATLAIALAIGFGSASATHDGTASTKVGTMGDAELVYALPDRTDRATCLATQIVMKWRLANLGLTDRATIAPPANGRIVVSLRGVSARLIDRFVDDLGSGLGARADCLFAIEATDAELADPESGLGATFDRATFYQALAERHLTRAAQARREPSLGPIPLFRNPGDWTTPTVMSEQSRFAYCPPATEMAGGRGAIIHASAERSVSAKRIAKLHPAGSAAAPTLQFEFDDAGKKRLRAISTHGEGQRLCIVLDGRVLTAPTVSAPLPGSGEIRFGNGETAKRLVVLVRAAGAMVPARLLRLTVSGDKTPR